MELSIRPFIGSKDFTISRNFYRDLGFEETPLAHNLSVFKKGKTAFYLQDANVKDWIDNTMIFIEVEDTDLYFKQLSSINLPEKYQNVRLTPVKEMPWGKNVFFMIRAEFCGTLENSTMHNIHRTFADNAVELYLTLREALFPANILLRTDTQNAVMNYFDIIEKN